MPEPASRTRRRLVTSSTISTQGVLQPWPMDADVAYGTEPRTPQNRTRMWVGAYYGVTGAARRTPTRPITRSMPHRRLALAPTPQRPNNSRRARDLPSRFTTNDIAMMRQSSARRCRRA